MMEAKKYVTTMQLPLPWEKLHGKVVLVTGASSGLGREFCLDLAKAGCKIIAAARRTDKLNSLCQQIHDLGLSSHSSSAITNTVEVPTAQCVAVELDVESEGSVIEACVDSAWNLFGRIDALVNNAGVRGTISSVLDLREEEWRNTVNTNVTGAWLVTKHVCTRMIAANLKGSVINISSATALDRGYNLGGVAYITSKAAMNAMTKVMALELGKYGIRVNSICPGIFLSKITENLFQKKWFAKVIENAFPLQSLGSIDPALTSLVRYLIHNSSSYVIGNMFIIDSGCTLPGIIISSSL